MTQYLNCNGLADETAFWTILYHLKGGIANLPESTLVPLNYNYNYSATNNKKHNKK